MLDCSICGWQIGSWGAFTGVLFLRLSSCFWQHLSRNLTERSKAANGWCPQNVNGKRGDQDTTLRSKTRKFEASYQALLTYGTLKPKKEQSDLTLPNYDPDSLWKGSKHWQQSAPHAVGSPSWQVFQASAMEVHLQPKTHTRTHNDNY